MLRFKCVNCTKQVDASSTWWRTAWNSGRCPHCGTDYGAEPEEDGPLTPPPPVEPPSPAPIDSPPLQTQSADHTSVDDAARRRRDRLALVLLALGVAAVFAATRIVSGWDTSHASRPASSETEARSASVGQPSGHTDPFNVQGFAENALRVQVAYEAGGECVQRVMDQKKDVFARLSRRGEGDRFAQEFSVIPMAKKLEQLTRYQGNAIMLHGEHVTHGGGLADDPPTTRRAQQMDDIATPAVTLAREICADADDWERRAASVR